MNRRAGRRNYADGYPCAVLRWPTPTVGAVLPQLWHRSGTFPMKVSGVIRDRPTTICHGMSVMRPQPAQVTRKCV